MPDSSFNGFEFSDLQISIADISLRFEIPKGFELSQKDSLYQAFTAQARGEKKPFAVLRVHKDMENAPLPGDTQPLFRSGKHWAIYLQKDSIVIISHPPSFHRPVWVARTNSSFSEIEIYISTDLYSLESQKDTVINPFRYPLDQIIMMYILAKMQGCIIHGAGVMMNESCYLFAGKSGAGKSTLSRLLGTEKEIKILSDDRVIVRKQKDRFNLYGTPWPGDAGFARNEKDSLKGLFFLHHSDQNRIISISPRRSFEKLLPVTSIPWYHPEVMQRVLSFCETVSSQIPAYDFYFTPGMECVRYLNQYINSQN